jgi:hypothetical protein
MVSAANGAFAKSPQDHDCGTGPQATDRVVAAVENFKAYFLALPKLGKACLPNRGEVNEYVRANGVRFYESIAFCRIKRLNGACSHHCGPRIVCSPDHSREFAVQQIASVQEPAQIA